MDAVDLEAASPNLLWCEHALSIAFRCCCYCGWTISILLNDFKSSTCSAGLEMCPGSGCLSDFVGFFCFWERAHLLNMCTYVCNLRKEKGYNVASYDILTGSKEMDFNSSAGFAWLGSKFKGNVGRSFA